MTINLLLSCYLVYTARTWSSTRPCTGGVTAMKQADTQWQYSDSSEAYNVNLFRYYTALMTINVHFNVSVRSRDLQTSRLGLGHWRLVPIPANTCPLFRSTRFTKLSNSLSDLQGHSRSLILALFDRSRDFQLVFRYNYVSIWYRLRISEHLSVWRDPEHARPSEAIMSTTPPCSTGARSYSQS